MNKKTAFTAVAKLSLKMGSITEFNVINVPHVASSLQVVVELDKIKYGRNTLKVSKPMSSLPQNTTVQQKLFSEK